MNEINKINLSEQTKFGLSEIIAIENDFHQEIDQRESYSKELGKYVTPFDDIDKVSIVLSANKWWNINYFIYKCCWSTSWNCK